MLGGIPNGGSEAVGQLCLHFSHGALLDAEALYRKQTGHMPKTPLTPLYENYNQKPEKQKIKAKI